MDNSIVGMDAASTRTDFSRSDGPRGGLTRWVMRRLIPTLADSVGGDADHDQLVWMFMPCLRLDIVCPPRDQNEWIREFAMSMGSRAHDPANSRRIKPICS
ncbi:hypothetical protein [Bradyrhizobium sp. Gha]|uniref:hypothetical protein n=1 Tax=Bradyrhizobium sp. Gha TaxID=1855318 RepID=UPI001160C0A1|nr:hypothetical protein [Bradyrhizobium sp. Gha]